MEHDDRYQVRNADLERALRTLGTLIDGEVPEGWAWGLFLVPFGNHEAAAVGSHVAGSGKADMTKAQGAVFWISNGDRQGMMDAVQGWLDDNKRRQKT